MKFGKVGPAGLTRSIGPLGPVGKAMLVGAIAFGVATLFTACSSTLTVGFLFVATNKQTPGQIEVYEVNSESGGLRTIPTSPFPSGGRNPVAEATTPDFKTLYVVNEDDKNIVRFSIGTDGKLYPQSTVNTPGAFPMAVAVNSAQTFLYAVDTLQPVPGCSLTNTCPGDLAVFPINKDSSLGTLISNNTNYPTYWPLLLTPSDTKTVLTPTALYVLPDGSSVYVAAYNATTNLGYIFAYSTNSDGSLTPLNGNKPLNIGSQPVALSSDSTGTYLYVVDKLANTLTSYTTAGLNSGSTTTVASVATGNRPSALAVDGTSFVYVTNSTDSTVSGYSINGGSLTYISTSTSDTNPVAITVDPRKLGFLYTVNFLGSSLSGFKIDPNAGTLINAQRSPYLSSVQPTAIAGIPHSGTATAVTK